MEDLIETILTITDDPRRDYSNDEVVTQKLLKVLTEQLHLHGVVRVGDKDVPTVPLAVDYMEFMKEQYTPNTPTEPLPAEGLAKSVCCGIGQACDKCGKILQWPVTSLKCDNCV